MTLEKIGETRTTPTPDDELAWLPAWKIREMFARRTLSPLEYANCLLNRVDKFSDLGAFISVFPEYLLEQASAATESRGEDLPLLHGLPVSLKDSIFTKGLRTTLGSRLFENFEPEVDSVASEQLRNAGAIIFGKTNLPEFSMTFDRRTLNMIAREAVNPWDIARTAGGSSGGAGAAVAAGLGPLAVGTDGGGSVRLPAAYNGIFGLYASRGRIPNGAGYFSFPGSGLGPMTRDVRDAAMLMQVMACVDERDVFTFRTPPPNYLAELENGVRGLRIAWSRDFGRVVPEVPEIADLCHEAAKTFRSLGANYTEPSLRIEDTGDPFEPDKEYSMDQNIRDVLAIKPDYQTPLQWASKLSPAEKALLSPSTLELLRFPPPLSEYAGNIPPAVRYRKKDRIKDIFSRIDLLVSPTATRTAFVCGEETVSGAQYSVYTGIVNACSYCAASVPVGFHAGMPVGLQIWGRPGDELLVLQAARALEKERPWAQHRPVLP